MTAASTNAAPDGPGVTQDGPGVTPDGPGVTPDGAGLTLDGPIPDSAGESPNGPIPDSAGESPDGPSSDSARPTLDGPSSGEPGAARPRRAPVAGDRQRDAERSRQSLLTAALEEFSLRGFAGARVADIARRAGVNKQLINYYFGSKEGLYLALQRAWLDREDSFAPPDLPLPDLVVRYLTDALDDPRSLRLLLWRGLADDSAPDGSAGRQADLERVGRRRAAGEVAADLDPAAVLLAGMAMVAAPIIMPGVARELFGVDPSSPEFRERYGEQLRRIVTHLGSGPDGQPPPGSGQATGGTGR
jgi:TetR/AcrR family transcriptional regulator